MENEQIAFLGEDDFLPAMNGACAEWRARDVSEATVESFDGARLRYYMAQPEQARACVVIVHGLCEFWGKYHETAWYFYRAGYAVFFLEQRGHGYSEGKLKERDVVYIDDYRTYVKDLRAFMERVVLPQTAGLKKIVFAHSMGGAIAALYLEKYPDVFDAATLSSPMFRLRAVNFSAPVLFAIQIYAKLFRKDKKLSPGERHFDPVMKFEGSSAKSKARYEYLFSQRVADWHYQTSGASLGWGIASVKATKRLLKNAAKIQCPTALATAGDDNLVAPEGHDAFAKKVPQTKRFFYPTSGHEIFNADTETRTQYFSDVLEQFDLFSGVGEDVAGG